jgi:predicted MFS family arabinose efflux permease
MWRDAGYALGALVTGIVADWVGLSAAIWVVAIITYGSGILVASRMYETYQGEGSRMT